MSTPMPRTPAMMLAAAWSLLVALPAFAGQHAICYESEMQQALPTAVWACHADAGGSCTISTPPGATSLIGTSLPTPLPGSVRVWQLPTAATFTATVQFYNASGQPSGTRTCSVNTIGPYGYGVRGPASPGAQLVGYTSDASGLVSTGVWKLVSPLVSRYNRVTLQVPKDFVAVGGGAVGVEWPNGALVSQSCQADLCGSGTGDWRRWVARTSDLQASNPHQTTVYAIGMRVTGLAWNQLVTQTLRISQNSYPAISAHPSNSASLPATLAGGPNPYAVLSGSAYALADASNSPQTLLGQFLTVTAPSFSFYVPSPCRLPCMLRSTVDGWNVASKDHIESHPGTVNTWLLALPPTLTIGSTTYRVLSKMTMATSAEAGHPSATASGLKGDYALVGIGAAVDWSQFGLPPTRNNTAGNLIWRLEPRPDVGGATVGSKDHVVSSPATITAFAFGIQLAP